MILSREPGNLEKGKIKRNKINLQEAHLPQPAHAAPVSHWDPLRGKERNGKSEKSRKKLKER